MTNKLTIEIANCGEGFLVTWKEDGIAGIVRRGYWDEDGDYDGKQALSDWEDIHEFLAVLVGRVGLTGDPEQASDG